MEVEDGREELKQDKRRKSYILVQPVVMDLLKH